MSDFPEVRHEPAKTYKVCGQCPHHKIVSACYTRLGPGTWVEYSCTHPNAWPEDHNIRYSLEEDRFIGRTEKTPQWCPFLRKADSEEAPA